MCPQHLKPSIPAGATGGRWHNGRSSAASKHQVWKPQQPKQQQRQQQEEQQHQQQQKPKEEAKDVAQEADPMPSIEPEPLGELDFGPPADLCLNEGSFPPQLLQQTATITGAATAAQNVMHQMPQPHFYLPPPAPEERIPQQGRAADKDAVWPPLSGAPRGGKKQKGSSSKQQQQQRLKQNKAAQQQKVAEANEVDAAAVVSSLAPCRAPPSSPASAAAADVDTAVTTPATAAAAPTATAAGVRAPPGLSGPDVQSALLRASFLGRTDIVRLCLERGASPAAADAIGRTPLHYAAATGVAEAVALLLKYAANVQKHEGGSATAAIVDLADKKRWTPLLIAVTKEHVPCVKLLLAAGANAQHLLCHRCAPCRGSSSAAATATGGDTAEAPAAAGPAADAATKGQTPAGKQAGNSTTNGEAPLQTWSAAIHFAAIKGSIPISELLLQHGSTGKAPLRYPTLATACVFVDIRMFHSHYY